MTKEKALHPNEQNQEDIYLSLSRLLARTDVASNSFSLSTVAMQCDDKLLEEFLNDKPATNDKTLKEFLQNHLYTAAFWGFYDVIKALIVYGADLNHKNKRSMWTPLHAACFQEHEKVVALLLESGASVHAKDSKGRTCIDIASVSPKIWPYFEQLKCQRTPDSDLIRKGLLKGPNNSNTKVNTPNSSRLSSSSSQMRSLLGGEIAATNSVKSATGRSSSLQLQ